MKRTLLVSLVVVALAVASSWTVFAANKASSPGNGQPNGKSTRTVEYLSNSLAASNADVDQAVIELKNPRFSPDAANNSVSFLVSFTCTITDSALFGFDTSIDGSTWNAVYARGLTPQAVVAGTIKSVDFSHYFNYLRVNFSTALAGTSGVYIEYPIE